MGLHRRLSRGAIEGIEEYGIIFDEKRGDDCHCTFYGEDGYGFLRIKEVSAGVSVMYSEYRMSECESRFDAEGDLFVLDFCREGRMRYANRFCVDYCAAGDVCIGNRCDHSGTYAFPLGYFLGVTVCFDLDRLGASCEARGRYPVDVARLCRKLLRDGRRAVVRDDACMQRLFSVFYDMPFGIGSEFYYHAICNLLLYLESKESLRTAHLEPFVGEEFADKVIAVRAYLVEDLETHHTIDELSKRFGISMTTLKTCFRAMYGDSIFSYMKSYRASRAATLLVEQPHLSIADIAVRCGYANPSKFSAAFKSVTGCLPSSYRKRHAGKGCEPEDRIR